MSTIIRNIVGLSGLAAAFAFALGASAQAPTPKPAPAEAADVPVRGAVEDPYGAANRAKGGEAAPKAKGYSRRSTTNGGRFKKNS